MSLDFLNKLANENPGSILSLVKVGNRKAYLDYTDQIAADGTQPVPYGTFIKTLPMLAEKAQKATKASKAKETAE